MRIHCKLSHGFLPAHSKKPQVFDATQHAVNGMPECQLCGRRFFRWQQLQKHIQEGACRVLVGESDIRKPHDNETPAVSPPAPPCGDAPDTRAEASPDILPSTTPLVQNADFHQSLSSWESWPFRPGARKQLLEHCVICGMWLASFRHVKQHVHRAHAEEVKHLLDPSLQLCRSFKSQLTRGRDCLFCHSRVGAPARHAEQRTVLFQLTIAKLRVQELRAKHGGQWGERRSRHLPLLFSGRGSPATGGSQREPPQEDKKAAPRVWTGSEDVSPPASASVHDTAARIIGAPAPAQQNYPAARGLPSTDPTGPGHGHVSQGGSAKPAPSHDGHGQRVEPQEGQGRPVPRVAATDGAAGQRGQGDAPEDANHCGDRGGSKDPATSSVAVGGRGLVLSELVLEVQEADSGYGKATSPARGGGQIAQPAPFEYEGRDCPDIPQPPSQAAGRGRRHIGGLQARDQLAGTGCHRRTRGPDEVHQQLRHGAHRDVLEKGNTESGAHEQAACPDGLWALDAATPAGSAELASTPQPNPLFRLVNPNNLCYLNSALYCLWLVAYSTGNLRILPQALQGNTAGSLKARQLLGFRLLGWSRPERQHDVSEFLAFILPKLTAGLITGRVEARQSLPEGSSVRTDSSLQQCIILPDMPRHSPELQALLNFWHQQNDMHALTCADPWIFLQLPRFAWSSGRARKTQQPYHIVRLLQVPVFQDGHSLHVRWVPYQVRALIQHHGRSPDAGHYTVVQLGDAQHWLIDDEKDPNALDARMTAHACTNMYVLALICQVSDVCSRSIEPLHIASEHGAPLAHLCANQRSAQNRDGLACSTALPPGVSTSADCGRHGNSESGIQRSDTQGANDGISPGSAAFPQGA